MSNLKKVGWLLLAIAVVYIPVAGPFFRAINTMIHESGHALAALISRGEVYAISLFASTEGVTYAATPGWWGMFFTGYAGYLFSALFAWLCAKLWQQNKDSWVLIGLFGFALLNLILWVRNPYGIAWILLFLLFMFLLSKFARSDLRRGAVLIIVFILIMDSVRSSLVIAFLGWAEPNQAGDASLLAEITFLPAAGWGFLFGLQGLLFGFMALRTVFRSPNQDRNSFNLDIALR